MSIVRDDGSWRIEGEGAKHAVLAYARNIDGIFDYELVPECINNENVEILPFSRAIDIWNLLCTPEGV